MAALSFANISVAMGFSARQPFDDPGRLSALSAPIFEAIKMDETDPLLEFFNDNFKFQSNPDPFRSPFGGVYGGSLNLRLIQENNLSIQVGGGVNYSTFETPSGLLGNDHLHPNLDVSIGINF